MVDTSYAGKFLFTQMTAMAKHGGKTYADGSQEKYAVPTTLRFLCIYINRKNSKSEICADSETGFSAHRVQLSVLRSLLQID